MVVRELNDQFIDFQAIENFVAERNIKFLILDFNGVLDDYYQRKVSYLKDVIGVENEHHLADLILYIDKQYMLNRSATIEQSFDKFFESRKLPITNEQRNKLTKPRTSSRLTEPARQFLDALRTPFVIYTSLSTQQLAQATGVCQYETYTRDLAKEDKPSIANLEIILGKYGYAADETCVVGDGLIDDLMPASLLGIHTILVSPNVSLLANLRQQ